MDKISVVIPVHNTEIYLRECLDSVINQSYKNIEIIIVDDNSTDSSQKIINEFVTKDPRVKSYLNEKTLGVAASRNIGLQQLTGGFVYFLDSDDFIDQFTLQILIKYGEQYDVVSGKNVNVNYAVNKSIEINEAKVLTYKGTRSKLFKNNSILNKLINVELIKQRKLQFNDSERYFSDLSMITNIISSVEKIGYCKNAFYYKRARNNPIDNPSLMQEDMLGNIKSFVSNMIREKENPELSKKTLVYLDNQFLNYYRKSIIHFVKELEAIESIYPYLVQAIINLEKNALNNKSIVLKREIKAIRNGDLNKYKRVIKQHWNLRSLKNAISGRQKFYTYLYNNFFIKGQVDKRLIVFESFLGKNYSDSPKYIYQHMIQQSFDYKYIWIFNEKGKSIPGNAKQVRRFSLQYYYYLAKAKYWISNSRIPKRLAKHPDNIYLQTWHGTPLKQLVFDMKDVHSANPNYKKDFYIQSRRWDYLISPNQYSSDIFRSAFKFDKKLLNYGYPRNDVLYKNDNGSYIDQLKSKLNLPKDKKVILYAPTWRDDEFFERGKYKFEIKLDLERLKQKISDDYIIILRMHYFIANKLDINQHKGFVFDYSTYDDIAELYLISDMLITDYSSVFFDYANLKRPILFYTYDLEKYRDTLRGFYIDIESEVPGPLLFDTNEVIEAINEIEEVQKEYASKYEAFYNRFCHWDDGHATERVIEEVFDSNPTTDRKK